MGLSAALLLTAALHTVDLTAGRPASVRLPGAALVSRITGTLVDSSGRRIGGPVAWSVRVASGRRTVVAELTGWRDDLRVPRPYALQLDLDDSLVFVGDAPVRVVVTYEWAELARARIAAHAVLAEVEQRDEDEIAGRSVSASWTWRAGAAGRLVVIVAPQFDRATTIVLEDAVTGDLVWRVRGPSRFASAATQLAEVQRPGVAVERGRLYRLRVERGVGEAAPVGVPVLLFVPRQDGAPREEHPALALPGHLPLHVNP